MWNNGLRGTGLKDNGLYLGPFTTYGPTSLRRTLLSVTIPSGSTTAIVSAALGYEPKAAYAVSVFRSGVGAGPAPCMSHGWASKEGPNKQWCVPGYLAPDLTAAASTMTRTAIYNNAIAAQISTTLGGAVAITFGDETITLTPTSAFAADVVIDLMILGGPAVQRAKAFIVNIASGTAEQLFVDPDFQPDFMVMAGSALAVTTPNTPQAGLDVSLAFATGPGDRQCVCVRHQNNTGSPGTFGRATTDRFFVGISATGTESKVLDLVRFQNPGFVLQGVVNSSASVFGVFAIKGPQVQLWRGNTQTGTGAFSLVAGLPFATRQVLAFAHPTATANEAAGTEPAGLVVGMANSEDQRSQWWHLYDYSPIGAGSKTDPLGGRSATRFLSQWSRTGQNTTAIAGEVSLTTLGDTELVADQVDGDPAGYWTLGVSFGDALPTVLTSRRRRHAASRLRRVRRRR